MIFGSWEKKYKKSQKSINCNKKRISCTTLISAILNCFFPIFLTLKTILNFLLHFLVLKLFSKKPQQKLRILIKHAVFHQNRAQISLAQDWKRFLLSFFFL
jgi:hypothetical protein